MSNLNVSQTLICAVTAGVALAPALIGNTAGSDAIFAPDAELKELFNGAHFTEGVSVAPDGTVYFSDITFTDAGRKYLETQSRDRRNDHFSFSQWDVQRYKV